MTVIKQRIIDTLPQSLATLPPLLQRLYAARGITGINQLDRDLNQLLHFDGLKGMPQAVARLSKAIMADEHILIIGDFDADGATSTALAVSALTALGAKQVNYLVPNRFEFGYGLTPGIVELAAKINPQLIVTVDNGIASIEGVLRAKALGIDVVVTDHHLAGEKLPDAVAIVNPNQPGCTFASKALAGVGVIFYVMLALRRHLISQEFFAKRGITPPNLANYLDLVALGTVADVVPLDKNNRLLVYQGLKRIRAGQVRPGIFALADVGKRELATLQASDLGFAIGPRLNAAGRLDDMSLGIECLLTTNAELAKQYAFELDALNGERKAIEQTMKEQAYVALAQLDLTAAALPVGLCLFDKSWHQGVIGILAGRLKERFHRPVIIFASAGEGELKGSARSVPGINIRDILDAIAKKHPALIDKFGGHAMAAGLSLKVKDLLSFKAAFDSEVKIHRSIDACVGELFTDGELLPTDFQLATAELINQAGPWGQGFPEPIFNNIFTIVEQRIVGSKHLKLVLQAENTKQTIDAIAFNIDEAAWPNYRATKLEAAYKLSVNHFRGRSNLQLMIEHMVAL